LFCHLLTKLHYAHKLVLILKEKPDRQFTYNVTLRRVCATIVSVEKQ